MTLNKSKAKLSSNVLDMKFMKKTKEKSEREADEEKRRIMFNSELPDSFIKGGDVCIMEPSFVPCIGLLHGRFSYGGMNPEIEKLMVEGEQKDVDKLKKMDGVSDKEMAERYSTLVGTMKKKFTSKRKWAAQNVVDVDNDDKDDACIEEGRSPNAKQRPKFRKPSDN